MARTRIMLDSFSGPASDLKKGHRTTENVLAALTRNPRVSTWDMDEHYWLRDCIADLTKRGLVVNNTDKEQFPWCRYDPTPRAPTPTQEGQTP
jgi:hypothetical protein